MRSVGQQLITDLSLKVQILHFLHPPFVTHLPIMPDMSLSSPLCVANMWGGNPSY